MSNENAIEQGKRHVAELIKNAAGKEGIEFPVLGLNWWSSDSPTTWQVEVKASNGRTAYKDFTAKQLTDCETDNQMKTQVQMKVASIIIQLTTD
jgi:hypothetical protein